ncbi:MAG TPA: hypothetical protein VMB82_09900 [Acidimicrobiales bacterium]|nr:hypothetical protein [Acidimicrobiales bacterium]
MGLLAVALYGVAAWLLDFHYGVYPPDSVFRMANAFYVLYSRHFHLAAIGFVWNPLTSIADMVPLAFKDLWAPLVTHDVAAGMVSVAFMAGAVHQVRAMLEEWGVGRAPRLVIVALFALDPMILYYGANGMSEALYVFTTVAVARYLSRWIATDQTLSLVYAAVMLALCYLAREEAVAVAAVSGALVLVVGMRRAEGPRRLLAGLLDTVVYLFLFLAAFVGWAFASLVITGSAFEQFTSQYGNSAQIQEYAGAYHLARGHYLSRLAHEGHALIATAPLLPILLVGVIVVARARRDLRVLAPVMVLGGGILFTLVGYLDNLVFPWFRFYILCIPLEALLAGFLLIPRTASGTDGAERRRRRRPGWVPVAVLGAVVALGPSLVTTTLAMDNPGIGIEESGQLAAVFHPSRFSPLAPTAKVVPVLPYLEGLHLHDGDVLTDDAFDCMATAIVRSANPKIFVITNDADFQRILADPIAWKAHYVVVPPPGGVYNAVNAQYPDLYRNGAGFSTLVRQFPATSLCPKLRLYRIVRHTDTP